MARQTENKVKKGKPSAGGSHMSGVWGRKKPRQLRREMKLPGVECE